MKLRLRAFCRYSRLSYYAYRHRYLAKFAAIGFFAIFIEILLVGMMPTDWAWLTRALLAFAVGLSVSFALNAWMNFQVQRKYMVGTFLRYAVVSSLSFTLNMVAIGLWRDLIGSSYGMARIVSSGTLFLLAYWLHRRYTFNRAMNFGIAVYTIPEEKVVPIFRKVGYHCDHVHIDLVDETMNEEAAPVDMGKLRQVKKLWKNTPIAMHFMTLEPERWLDQTWDYVDWYLFHANTPDLMERLTECRLHGKKVGVVWHDSCPVADVIHFLPHVDFVMVLGIAKPGVSGQKLHPRALAMAEVFDSLRDRYQYEVMFDGSVNAETIPSIRATYVVAASAVLRATDPVHMIHVLKTGARYEGRGSERSAA